MTPRWLLRLVARPEMQERLARIPLLRRVIRREGSVLFDLMQGFVRSQVLFALVSSGMLDRLADGPATRADLAETAGLSDDRAALLIRAGIALGLLSQRGERVTLTIRGTAFVSVPGLSDMVLHHSAFYADMADPLALLKGEGDTELSRFWPYVHGAAAAEDPEAAARYSDLMARSQIMVAADTLDTVSLGGIDHLLDIGGGAGVFLSAAGARAPGMTLSLFELPTVLPMAQETMEAAGMSDRFIGIAGSFRDDPLPDSADAVSLVRVLYDHSDDTVRALLSKVHAALPPGGRLIISEPMSGGDRPDPATDVYFAFYTLAMKTGRTRSQAEIETLCHEAGFVDIAAHGSRRPFVTSVVTARKSGRPTV